MSTAIDRLWTRIYSMVQSQSGPKTWGSFQALPPKFDQELLNNVSKLKSVTDTEKTELIDAVRGQILVAGSVDLVGHADLEELQQLLEQIETGE